MEWPQMYALPSSGIVSPACITYSEKKEQNVYSFIDIFMTCSEEGGRKVQKKEGR